MGWPPVSEVRVFVPDGDEQHARDVIERALADAGVTFRCETHRLVLPGRAGELPEAVVAEATALRDGGDHIGAIKVVRDALGCSIIVAKLAVASLPAPAGERTAACRS